MSAKTGFSPGGIWDCSCGEARVEVGDDLFGFRGVAGEGGELADVGAHVGEGVLGLEGYDAVAEVAEEGDGCRGGEAAGEDEVGLERDDFFGEAVIGGRVVRRWRRGRAGR